MAGSAIPEKPPLHPALESEAIEILLEAVDSARRPVMLYSIGKDSSALLHLARKAFHPAPPPFPLLHVDTTWKFRDMYAHRARVAAESGMELIVHTNAEGLAAGVNPFTHGSSYYTDVMKTQALRQALDAHGFDVVLGGARRDEERSRAKERVFSLRAAGHRWDPRAQRPELWNLYNTHVRPGETLRVFPLSNWTELDVWEYIRDEAIAVVPLYLARERPVVRRGTQWIVVDDERLPLGAGERPEMRRVRFRTLGCYPLSAAIESAADSLEAVIAETRSSPRSEREGRLIDGDQPASMERKKQEGYF
jgi:sulfate adenylyltransferase subunit 2